MRTELLRFNGAVERDPAIDAWVKEHRGGLAVGEALNCPEVGEAWYTHGPSRTASFIRSVLESHPDEPRSTTVPIDRLAVLLHDSLTGDVLYRLLAGVGRHTQDTELESLARNTVDVILGNCTETVQRCRLI
jgi:hypothetical protein